MRMSPLSKQWSQVSTARNLVPGGALSKCVFGIEHFLDVERSVFNPIRQPSQVRFTQDTLSPLEDFSEHVVLLVRLHELLANDALEAFSPRRMATEAVM